jgi:hypothetical protein
MVINEKDLLLSAQDEATETDQDGNESNFTKINCRLRVGVDPTNIAVYVCKQSKQCFNFTAAKCCGSEDIDIEAQGFTKGVLVVKDFGTFTLVNGGICFEPDSKLGTGIKDKKITFKASACGVETLFDVTFVFDPCKCCCPCNSCCH